MRRTGIVGLNSFFGFAAPLSAPDKEVKFGLEVPPRLRSLSPRKEGSLNIYSILINDNRKLFTGESLAHYLPDLLAFKGDIAALRASFFTRSDGDGLAPEPLIFNFLPSWKCDLQFRLQLQKNYAKLPI